MNQALSYDFPARAGRLRRLLTAGFAVVSVALAGLQAVRAEDRITVKLDQAQVLQLPPNTSIVVLGNPIIADVTLLKKNNSVILTGKSFGETNLIALDGEGHTLGESTVQVVAPASNMIVQLGMSRQSYACDPRCQPTFELGDDSQFTTGVSGQIQSRNTLAQPAAH